jgi:hypothetical protein
MHLLAFYCFLKPKVALWRSAVPVRPTSHFTWQVLRTVKRSKKPPSGRDLRLVPSRNTKDGSFLNILVDDGLLERLTGTATAPFDATYTLTDRGEHAAEYGEYEYILKPKPPEQAPPPRAAQVRKGRKSRG